MYVYTEAARVLRTGGVMVISFTDKCLASKALLGWKERGNLERSQVYFFIFYIFASKALPGWKERGNLE
jgi:hypothetical protein